jgi:hypothetical protein
MLSSGMNWCWNLRGCDRIETIKGKFLSCIQQSVSTPATVLFSFPIIIYCEPAGIGAYSLCDKIIWASRLLISSFSSAVYPKSTLMYRTSPQSWKLYKRKRLNILLAIVFSLGGLFLFLFPGLFLSN